MAEPQQQPHSWWGWPGSLLSKGSRGTPVSNITTPAESPAIGAEHCSTLDPPPPPQVVSADEALNLISEDDNSTRGSGALSTTSWPSSGRSRCREQHPAPPQTLSWAEKRNPGTPPPHSVNAAADAAAAHASLGGASDIFVGGYPEQVAPEFSAEAAAEAIVAAEAAAASVAASGAASAGASAAASPASLAMRPESMRILAPAAGTVLPPPSLHSVVGVGGSSAASCSPVLDIAGEPWIDASAEPSPDLSADPGASAYALGGVPCPSMPQWHCSEFFQALIKKQREVEQYMVLPVGDVPASTMTKMEMMKNELDHLSSSIGGVLGKRHRGQLGGAVDATAAAPLGAMAPAPPAPPYMAGAAHARYVDQYAATAALPGQAHPGYVGGANVQPQLGCDGAVRSWPGELLDAAATAPPGYHNSVVGSDAAQAHCYQSVLQEPPQAIATPYMDEQPPAMFQGFQPPPSYAWGRYVEDSPRASGTEEGGTAVCTATPPTQPPSPAPAAAVPLHPKSINMCSPKRSSSSAQCGDLSAASLRGLFAASVEQLRRCQGSCEQLRGEKRGVPVAEVQSWCASVTKQLSGVCDLLETRLEAYRQKSLAKDATIKALFRRLQQVEHATNDLFFLPAPSGHGAHMRHGSRDGMHDMAVTPANLVSALVTPPAPPRGQAVEDSMRPDGRLQRGGGDASGASSASLPPLSSDATVAAAAAVLSGRAQAASPAASRRGRSASMDQERAAGGTVSSRRSGSGANSPAAAAAATAACAAAAADPANQISAMPQTRRLSQPLSRKASAALEVMTDDQQLVPQPQQSPPQPGTTPHHGPPMPSSARSSVGSGAAAHPSATGGTGETRRRHSAVGAGMGSTGQAGEHAAAAAHKGRRDQLGLQENLRRDVGHIRRRDADLAGHLRQRESQVEQLTATLREVQLATQRQIGLYKRQLHLKDNDIHALQAQLTQQGPTVAGAAAAAAAAAAAGASSPTSASTGDGPTRTNRRHFPQAAPSASGAVARTLSPAQQLAAYTAQAAPLKHRGAGGNRAGPSTPRMPESSDRGRNNVTTTWPIPKKEPRERSAGPPLHSSPRAKLRDAQVGASSNHGAAAVSGAAARAGADAEVQRRRTSRTAAMHRSTSAEERGNSRRRMALEVDAAATAKAQRIRDNAALTTHRQRR